MEKGINAYILEKFKVQSQDIRTYSPLVLAYIGDCIYELTVRSLVVARGNISPNHMHNISSSYVKAHTQAFMMDVLEPLLTEEEADAFRRGRNAKSGTTAKNASVSDYRRATGFEALMGYLYLSDENDRLMELIGIALDDYDNNPTRYKSKKAVRKMLQSNEENL